MGVLSGFGVALAALGGVSGVVVGACAWAVEASAMLLKRAAGAKAHSSLPTAFDAGVDAAAVAARERGSIAALYSEALRKFHGAATW